LSRNVDSVISPPKRSFNVPNSIIESISKYVLQCYGLNAGGV
jgi:hypothetical protein